MTFETRAAAIAYLDGIADRSPFEEGQRVRHVTTGQHGTVTGVGWGAVWIDLDCGSSWSGLSRVWMSIAKTLDQGPCHVCGQGVHELLSVHGDPPHLFLSEIEVAALAASAPDAGMQPNPIEVDGVVHGYGR